MRRMGSGCHLGRSLGSAALLLALLPAGIVPGAAQTVGWAPRYAMIQARGGDFLGTTSQSAGGGGTLFTMTRSGRVINLHNFSASTDGSQPTTVVQGEDGSVYGTALSSGANNYGTLFQRKMDGAFTVLYSFTGGNDGGYPNALTLGKDSNLYGSTLVGGAGTTPGTLGPGTIFKITPSGAFTTLYSFTGGPFNLDGASPSALTQGKDGNFYGTTQSGGANNWGTVFQITPSGTLTTIYSFADRNDGATPMAGLTPGKDGNLYGTTQYGGANQWGVIFKVTPAGTLTSLYNFAGSSDGGAPESALALDRHGNFYGTNGSGGANGDGVIFQWTPSGTLTTLYDFTSVGPSGVTNVPQAGLMLDNNGNLYGTTQAPSALWIGPPVSGGTIFRLTPSGEAISLYTFTWAGFGWTPEAPLADDGEGNFYGTTVLGGTNNQGVVFRITPGRKAIVLHSFDGADGADWYWQNSGLQTSLTLGRDHNFYGVTYGGGLYNEGSVYRITRSGQFTTLYSFTRGSDGAYPLSTLTLGRDGNFYGTANVGGAAGNGTVFKITPSGAFTPLYSFSAYSPTTYTNADGAYPTGALVQGKDGSFYGTTDFYGGAYGYGTVFKITPSGTLTTLYSFTGGNDGNGPVFLTWGKDGNFYGTTQTGGAYGSGTVFKMTPEGALTTLYAFTGGNDGSYPNALTLGNDGNFYGTTTAGGANGASVMFQITPSGTMTTLPFDLPAPSAVTPALTLGKDGNFYGTYSADTYSPNAPLGTYGGGIFRVTSGGALTDFYDF